MQPVFATLRHPWSTWPLELAFYLFFLPEGRFLRTGPAVTSLVHSPAPGTEPDKSPLLPFPLPPALPHPIPVLGPGLGAGAQAGSTVDKGTEGMPPFMAGARVIPGRGVWSWCDHGGSLVMSSDMQGLAQCWWLWGLQGPTARSQAPGPPTCSVHRLTARLALSSPISQMWMEAEALRGGGQARWQESEQEFTQAWQGQALRLGLGGAVLTSPFGRPSPQVGFINSLKFSSSGNFLVAGVGQEHR